MGPQKTKAAGLARPRSGRSLDDTAHGRNGQADPQPILALLKGVKATGKDSWDAFCPVHPDGDQSLGITVAGDKILLKCRAKCRTEDVLKALGLDWSALFASDTKRKPRKRSEQVWEIRNVDGELVAEHIRVDGPSGKRMWWRRDGKDGLGGMPARSLPLYGSEKIKDWADEDTVIIGEGEKCADAIEAAGFRALATVCGASVVPEKAVLKPLALFPQVILWADHDKAGCQHMIELAEVLRELGIEVMYIESEGSKGEDAADLTAEAIKELVEAAGPMPATDRLDAGNVTTTEHEERRQDTVTSTAFARLTEGAAGERFADEHHGDLRYCRPWRRWLWWTGSHWAIDTTGEAERRAKATVLSIYTQAGAEVDDGLRQQLVSWARKLDTSRGHTAMMALAASDQRIAVRPEDLDTDGWLLNAQNGTIHLKEGKLRPHQREDLITRLAPVEYHEDAVSEAWEEHLQYFLPDPDVRRQVQRDLGVSLVGGTLAEVLSIWHGYGANAKTTTWSVLLKILGDYAIEAPPGLLLQRKHDGHPTELARLRGSRLVVSSEVSPGAALNEQRVKDLTGGGMQSARYTYGDFFDFERSWSIVLACNHKPRIRGSDDGIWRRVRIVPWTVSAEGWSGRRPQDEVVKKLVDAGPAILRWLVDGLHDWLRDPQWIAEKVTAATAQYREEQDRLTGWLSECCEIGPHHEEAFSRLWDSYVSWCEANREKALGRNTFRDRLAELGFEAVTGAKRTAMREGLRLLTPAEREARDTAEPPDTETANPQTQKGDEANRVKWVNRLPGTFPDSTHGELTGQRFTHFTHETNSEAGTETTGNQAETLWVNRVCDRADEADPDVWPRCVDCGRAVPWVSEAGFCPDCGGAG